MGITNTSPRLTSRKYAWKYSRSPRRSEGPGGLLGAGGDIIWATVIERAVGSGGGSGPNELGMIETEGASDPEVAPILNERAGLQTTSPLRRLHIVHSRIRW